MSEAARKSTIAPDGLPLIDQPAWRQDFPIDWPQDHFVARRDFTRFLVLASLPFALVQLGIGVLNWFRRRREQPPVKAIAPLSDIPVGGVLSFAYPNEDAPCLLLRPDEDTLRAFSQKCTHLGCAVTPELEQQCFLCPCHRGYFALDTGRPLAGPPRRPLPRITLEVRRGVLYATGVEVNHA
jgi:nitrite reductase/ring-hydroxylating ferredoxin subunit